MLARLLVGDLDHRVRLGEALEALDQLGEITGGAALDGDTEMVVGTGVGGSVGPPPPPPPPPPPSQPARRPRETRAKSLVGTPMLRPLTGHNGQIALGEGRGVLSELDS